MSNTTYFPAKKTTPDTTNRDACMFLVIAFALTFTIGAAIGAVLTVIIKKESFSVVTYPYKELHGTDGIFSDDRKAEIGYKFQLFVNGIPCFDAHKIPIETLEKKEISLQKIEAATQSATRIIEHMASLHPAIKAYSAAPELASSAKQLANNAGKTKKQRHKE